MYQCISVSMQPCIYASMYSYGCVPFVAFTSCIPRVSEQKMLQKPTTVLKISLSGVYGPRGLQDGSKTLPEGRGTRPIFLVLTVYEQESP